MPRPEIKEAPFSVRNQKRPAGYVGGHFKSQSAFFQALLRSPREIGAICPSSRFLARSMIAAMPANDGLVLDLGSGTGVMTGHLLAAGLSAENIVAVERCSALSAMVKNKFPQVTHINQDACQLKSLLDQMIPQKPLRAIISSLPFRSLPEAVAEKISHELCSILEARGGLLIQFSYALWSKFPLAAYGLKPLKRFKVLLNIPPAVVEVYGAPQTATGFNYLSFPKTESITALKSCIAREIMNIKLK